MRRVELHDETLRDGLQSAAVSQPRVDDKVRLLYLIGELGIDSACLGMPVTSDRAALEVTRLADELASSRLPLRASCAARTVQADIAAIAAVTQRTGLPIRVMAFIGISQVRRRAEDWSWSAILARVAAAVRFARQEGLRVCLVTEDTTRTPLDAAADVYAAALDVGADRICVCDTVGHAVPAAAAAAVSGLAHRLAARGFPAVGIDWHGHNDRGLALASSLAAADAGADRLHGTALGMGERAGNTPMEQLLANLNEECLRSDDLRAMPEYCATAGRACGVHIPPHQPLVGNNAYSTVAGVHAAAIRKAEHRGMADVAEHVYAAIPASRVGRRQSILISPVSGRANVLHWLAAYGIEPDDGLVAAILRAAADVGRVLTDADIFSVLSERSTGVRLLPRVKHDLPAFESHLLFEGVGDAAQ
jgi:2-isopropylmalate synthase